MSNTAHRTTRALEEAGFKKRQIIEFLEAELNKAYKDLGKAGETIHHLRGENALLRLRGQGGDLSNYLVGPWVPTDKDWEDQYVAGQADAQEIGTQQ